MTAFDAIGRLAIGQVRDAGNPSPTATGVAGTGVAGQLSDVVTITQAGAVGIGVVGALVASIAIGISGLASPGIARAPATVVSVVPAVAQGTGVGRTGLPADSEALQGVAGIGTVGALTPTSSTPSVLGVAGIGVAGSLTPSDEPPGIRAFGTGVAGILRVMISGGGGSRQIERPRQGMHTGFQRVKPRPQPVIAEEPERKIQPPPARFVRAPIIRPPTPPARGAPALVDPGLVPDAAVLLRQIVQAEAASRRQRQDEQDIAELLAFLDSQEKT